MSLKASMTCRSKSYACLGIRSAVFIKSLPDRVAQCRVLEELSPFSLDHDPKRRLDLMLPVWAYAPHFVQLCALPADAGDAVVEAKTGTEPAETRAAFPSIGREVDAGHLSVRTRAAPLSATCLCRRRTSGGQGLEKKTDNRANTARRFTSTTRIRRVCGSCQCLASCLCPFRRKPTVRRM
jgi:hypothetical protein